MVHPTITARKERKHSSMNTNTTLSKGSRIQLNQSLAARAGILLLLLTLPAAVQAQFNYTNNSDGTATITGYTGPGGDVSIPSTINGLSVTSIGYPAFYNGASPGPGILTSITIPDSVTSIGDYAFAWNLTLSRATLGDGLRTIGAGAFSYCGLITITIPSGVTSIGDRAFTYCGNLTGVYFQGNAPSLGGSFVFQGDNNIVYYAPGTTGWGWTFGGPPTALLNPPVPFFYTTNGGTITITGFSSPVRAVTIPDTINGLPVTSIGDDAFFQCTNLTSVTIGNGVTNIGNYAFYGCTSLTNITIPNSVTSIGNYTFPGCGSLTNITIPDSVTSIGDGTFEWCSSLTNITIPNSVTNIGGGAFMDCTSLTSVTIGTNVASIGDRAFGACSSLTSVMIPSSVTDIRRQVFVGCTSLPAITVDVLNPVYSSVAGVLFNKSQTTLNEYPAGKPGTSYTIPNSVVSIGDWAFHYCTSLTNLTIPNSVTSIGNYAFEDCASLTGVHFEGNAPSLGGSDVFYDNNKPTVYYLPGTTGWGATFGGCPIALWVQEPTIQSSPLTQTAETGSAVGLWVDASSPLPLFYLWYLNATNLISWSTNCELQLTNISFSQSGAYTAVISNVLGAVASPPALLNVIAAVERRPVWGVKVTGESSSSLNVDYADSLGPTPNWTTLNSVSLTSRSQYCFDLTLPLPPQRFYRVWQTGTPVVVPSLDLHLVPAITLTGNIGDSVRLDYINQFGPTDAWVTLDTVTLTNTS